MKDEWKYREKMAFKLSFLFLKVFCPNLLTEIVFLCYNTGDSVQCRKAAIIAMGTK